MPRDAVKRKSLTNRNLMRCDVTRGQRLQCPRARSADTHRTHVRTMMGEHGSCSSLQCAADAALSSRLAQSERGDAKCSGSFTGGADGQSPSHRFPWQVIASPVTEIPAAERRVTEDASIQGALTKGPHSGREDSRESGCCSTPCEEEIGQDRCAGRPDLRGHATRHDRASRLSARRTARLLRGQRDRRLARRRGGGRRPAQRGTRPDGAVGAPALSGGVRPLE